MGNYKRHKYITKVDISILLDFVNSASYHDEFNDGRIMKMIAPDYQIFISTGSDRKSFAIQINIWSHGLIEIGRHWHKPYEGQRLNDFLAFLK